MKYINNWLVTGILLSAIIIISFVLRNKQHHMNQLKIRLEKAIEKAEGSKNNTITRSSLEKKTESIKIDSDIVLINSTSGDTTYLNQLLDTQKLIFRYSDLNCMSCVDQEIANIKNLAKEIGKQNILITATYNSMRELQLFKRANNLNLPVYKLPNEGLGLPLEKANVPFLFMIDKEFQSKLVFVPEKTLPSMSEEYYRIIKSRFF